MNWPDARGGFKVGINSRLVIGGLGQKSHALLGACAHATSCARVNIGIVQPSKSRVYSTATLLSAALAAFTIYK